VLAVSEMAQQRREAWFRGWRYRIQRGDAPGRILATSSHSWSGSLSIPSDRAARDAPIFGNLKGIGSRCVISSAMGCHELGPRRVVFFLIEVDRAELMPAYALAVTGSVTASSALI